jgi:uncharacterized protein YndB with AHSA1/START domain
MARIEGEIVIARPVEEVFDFVADQRHEPRFNSRMRSSQLLTPEPIGCGSRFQAEMSMLGRPVDLTVEFTEFERPRLLASRSWSRTRGGRGKPMLTEGELTLEPVGEGTRMHWSWRVEPPGLMRALSPIAAWIGRRQELRIWTALKRLLESGSG